MLAMELTAVCRQPVSRPSIRKRAPQQQHLVTAVETPGLRARWLSINYRARQLRGSILAQGSSQEDPMAWNNWTDDNDTPSGEYFDVSILRTLSLDEEEESPALPADFTEDFVEKVVLVGVGEKQPFNKRSGSYSFSIEDSLQELERLSDTAGLEVVGVISQNLAQPNPRTYIGSGKIRELKDLIEDTGCFPLPSSPLVDLLLGLITPAVVMMCSFHTLQPGAVTVLCDDELSPRQQRNLERALDNKVRVGDRTALILDVFSQSAATREGKLQVELAQVQYELPRLTRMWTHLERQSGAGQVKGMGEKQIEIDKRLLRKRSETLQKDIDEISKTRSVYRRRRREAGMPVVALVGYTNAGKSTLINAISDANTLAEDKLFATLDPTTRRLVLNSGKEVLVTDTVGFIQKLPTQLVAAFRATLEEIAEASVLLHVVDVSDPKAAAQSEAVHKVLKEIDADSIPMMTVWNKADVAADPDAVARVASGRPHTACISAARGVGLETMLQKLEAMLETMMLQMTLLVPYSQGDIMGELYRKGVVNREEFCASGILVKASVPQEMVGRCRPLVTEQQFSCHEEDDGVDVEEGKEELPAARD